jgi:hypothetical protein
MKNAAKNYSTINKFLFYFFLIILFGCSSSPSKENFSIKKDPAFPRWLKAGNYSTSQSSGAFFLGIDKNGNKNFLLADDIGKIHHFKIKDDTVFSFSPVYLGENVKAFLDTFPKWDFEEITYDKYTNSAYLSIEGNKPDPKKYVGIYKITFQNNNVYSDTISGIEKLHVKPESLFLKYTADNIGYEGLTVDSNYFYLGLEGFSRSGIFADSTYLFIVDKSNLQIIKQVNTKPFDIHTICGLYSDKNKSLWGVDRNYRKLFHLTFNNSLEVKDYGITNIPINIPAYPQFNYVAALESVTMDDEKNIYFIDDPWETFYVPSQRVLKKLDNITVNNFKKFVPVIYKFKLTAYQAEN